VRCAVSLSLLGWLPSGNTLLAVKAQMSYLFNKVVLKQDLFASILFAKLLSINI
jgi:hypothetical protein